MEASIIYLPLKVPAYGCCSNIPKKKSQLLDT